MGQGPKKQRSRATRKVSAAPADAEVQLAGKRVQFLSLPREVRSMIEEEGLPRLRAIQIAIAADARLPMPPIRVEPWGLVSPEKDAAPAKV